MSDTGPDPEIVRTCELGEARAWEEIYRSTAALPGNPLGVHLADVGGVPAAAVREIDISLFNRTVGLGLLRPVTDVDLDAIDAFYATHARDEFVVTVAPRAEPADLAARLEARGLVAGRFPWPKLWHDLQAIPAARTDFRIRQATPDDEDVFAELLLEAFEFPPIARRMGGGLIGRPGWTHYLALAGDEPVGTGALYVRDAVGWLGFGGTKPAFRGRGGQSAMFARRLSDAAELGCRIAVTETGPDMPDAPNPSLHNMIRAGFKTAYVRPNYVKRPAAQPA